MKRCALAGVKQGQIKVARWMVSTPTALSDLLKGSTKGALLRPGRGAPRPRPSTRPAQSSRCHTGLVCDARYSFAPYVTRCCS